MTTTKPRALGIMMAISLTLSGATALSDRLDTSIQCGTPGPQGLFVTREKYEYANSENACIAMGGSPVDLNNENFPIASEFIRSCAGPDNLAWIGSWDYKPGSSDCQDCLSVHIDGKKPNEGVVDQNCKGAKPVLCQVGTSAVKHDPGYQLGTDTPRRVNIAPHYGAPAYGGYGGYPPSVYTGNTPVFYPGYYGQRFSPPHGPHGGFPGGVFPGGPGFGNGGSEQIDWKKKKAWKKQAAAAAAPVTVTVASGPAKTVTVTKYAETILTNIELVTKHETETDISTQVETVVSTAVATQYVTDTSTVINTVTKDVTELMTTTELSVREGTTVTLDPSTVTLAPVTVTQGGETVTIPASTITLKPGTVTLPAETITLSPVTVTQPPVTSTKTLPPVTSVVYAVRDNTITTTVFSRLPAITSYKTEYEIKYTTSTIITTQQVPGPTVTKTATQTVTVQPQSTGSTSESGAEWMFPFELPDFSGPGKYTLTNGAVITVKSDGTYTLISGSLPSGSGGSGSQITGNAGSDFKFPFPFQNFKGPGSYTLSNGAVITVKPDGAYTFLMGGPPSTNSSGSEISFSFPFNVPGFQGPGLYTLSPGNVMTVKSDGSYTFIQGGPPKNDNPPNSSSNSGSMVSFQFPFNVPGFTGPGTYTLSPGNVVSIKPDGSYTFVQGGPPPSGGNTGSGGGGGSFSLPFNVPGFTGPGTYTLSPGNVVSIKPDGSYTFLQGGPPSGTGSGGGGGGGSFSLPFNVPGFTGPGTYTLSPGNVVSIKGDGSYTFLQGGPPSGTGNGGGGGGGSISLPFNVPGFQGPGVYTLSPGNVVSIKNDGSYTFLQGGPPNGGGGGGGGAIINGGNGGGGGSFSLPFQVPGFTGPGTYTLSPGNVVSIKNDGSYTFLQGGPPNGGGGGGGAIINGGSGGSGGGGGSFSLPFQVPGFTGPGTYTLSPGNVVSIKGDGSYTFLQGGPPNGGGGGGAIINGSNGGGGSSGTLQIPGQPGIYTLSNGAVVSVSSSGSYSFIKGGPNGSSSSSTGSISLPFNVPGFQGPGTYTLSPGNVVSIKNDGSYTFLQGGPPGNTPAPSAQANDDVEVAGAEEPEIMEMAQPSESAEAAGFNLAAVSFPAFARRAIATFV